MFLAVTLPNITTLPGQSYATADKNLTGPQNNNNKRR